MAPRSCDVFAQVAEGAGYGQVVSPLLEDLGVFQRIGDATDVVTKEMYDFVDKGGRHVALRPELTASICRAFVQHRPLTPWKVWYTGSQFRYEKPQRGRYRQFDQVGIEVLGADDPYLDVEIIALGWEFFRALGLRQVTLLLNSLGEPDDRARYVEALQAYFEANLESLSEESKSRCRRTRCACSIRSARRMPRCVAAAPQIADFYSDDAAAHFAAVQAGLTALGIPFTVDTQARARPRLLPAHDVRVRRAARSSPRRTHSAVAVATTAWSKSLGGPATPGVGFALGLDRTLIACDDEGVFARARHRCRRVRGRHHRRAGSAAHHR